MSEREDGWQEYKKLVINELERNDNNIQKVLEAVQQIGSETASIKTSIEGIKENFDKHSSREKELEIRILSLEKDLTSLKAKVIMIGGFVGTLASIGMTVLLKALL